MKGYYISYFSVRAIRHRDQNQVMEERVRFSKWLQRGSTTTRKVTFHYTGSEQRKLEVEQGYKLSKPTPAMEYSLTMALRYHLPPKSVTNWRLSVQMHESMGDYFSFKLPQRQRKGKTETQTKGMEHPALWKESMARLMEDPWDADGRAHRVWRLAAIAVFVGGRFTFSSCGHCWEQRQILQYSARVTNSQNAGNQMCFRVWICSVL